MDRRKPRIFNEVFKLKIVRILISFGVFSLAILALLGYMILFWTSAAEEIGLGYSGTVLFINLAKVFLIITVVLLGLVMWVSFLISRNLFGPLIRLRNNMEMLIRGEDPDNVRFRRTDELVFHYLSEPFNQIIERLKNLNKDVKEVEKGISDFIEKTEKGMIKKKAFVLFAEELKTKVAALAKFR